MGLVAFDFDGTLTDAEMTVALGEQAGVADEMEAITEQAMNDEIEYAESLRRRVRKLAGLSGEDVATAFDSIELRAGVPSLLNDLSAAEVKTAIVTGGFERGVKRILDRAETDVDVIVANRLVVEDKRLTGEVEGPLIEGTKDIALRALIDEFETSLGETTAVGDGANDLPMLQAAGVGIGFQPKPAIESSCDLTVDSIPALREALTDLGYLSTS